MSGIEIVQATAWYGPHNVGGTESYVEDLAGALTAQGIMSTIFVPRGTDAPESYVHAGRSVETYPVGAVVDRGAIARGEAHVGFEIFKQRLTRHRGAIYHQHAWTRGCGPWHLRAARDLGMRTVITVHVPNAACLRGTMLRFGSAPCEGQVDETLCGACWARSRGVPRPAAAIIAGLPLATARRVRRRDSRLATLIAARALGAERLGLIRDMAASADRVVAVCGWLADFLVANGVPASRLRLHRQGLSDAFLTSAKPPANGTMGRRRNGAMSIVYLGRWDYLKGVHILVRALRRSSALVTLHLHGVASDDDSRAYAAKVRRLAGDDPRIHFAGPVPRQDVAAVLGAHDVLAVPSILLETGPLIVLEAQAVGLFVLGSRLGGIAELVDDGVNGRLVEAGHVAAWTKALEELAARWEAGALLERAGDVRMMSTVAAEMADLYREIRGHA